MFKKSFNTIILLILISSLLIACTNNQEIQTEALQAIDKQSEMKSYSFEGSAKLGLGDGLVPATNPLTLGIVNMLKESTLEWKGATENNPARLETTLKLTPNSSNSQLELPVLIKDNKLYFNIPAINKPGEFFVMDLSTSSIGSNNGIQPEALQQTSATLSDVMRILFASAEAKWLREDKEPAALPDGTTGTSIRLEITSSNEQAVNKMMQSKTGEMIDKLASRGIISSATAEKWKNSKETKIEIKAPSQLQLIIDKDGNIRSQTIDFKLAITDENGTTNTHAITFEQSYSNINTAPDFQMPIPENAKSFDDVLQFLAPNKTNK